MADRRHIPNETKLRLFSEAAGHCQRPGCLLPLFPAEMGGDKHIAEMAHIIPHGETGPRHQEKPDGDFAAESFENLILLCPTCHTIVDKDPASHSRSTLLSWKQNHLGALVRHQGIRPYAERCQVRGVIEAAMAENKAVWADFAPNEGSLFSYDPESETARTWEHRMRNVILPNNFRIQSVIKANLDLLTEAEREVFGQYQEHVRCLVERHICGISGGMIRYPAAMHGILK